MSKPSYDGVMIRWWGLCIVVACGGGDPSTDAATDPDVGMRDASADSAEDSEVDAADHDVGENDAGDDPCTVHESGSTDLTRSLAGWPDRDLDVHVPPTYDCTEPTPVVLFLHGGGGTKEGASRTACLGLTSTMPPDTSHPNCWSILADAEGFVVVYPNGTPNDEGNRGFNAGGGNGGYACVNEHSCSNDIDDVAYFSDLLDDLETVVNVDRARVFSTGISNGGAMSHRLACELSDRIAAVAAFGGQAQHALSDPDACAPSRPVPVMMVHGTDDRCWPYESETSPGESGALACGADSRLAASLPESEAFWAAHNGCTDVDTTPIADTAPADGSTATRRDHSGCTAGGAVAAYQVEGGGHTVPGGWQYLPIVLIGGTNRDFSGSMAAWEFFETHPMP